MTIYQAWIPVRPSGSIGYFYKRLYKVSASDKTHAKDLLNQAAYNDGQDLYMTVPDQYIIEEIISPPSMQDLMSLPFNKPFIGYQW